MDNGTNSEDVLRCREDIDLLDAELVRLLNARASIALDLAHIKQGLGWDIWDAERERQVLSQVAHSNSGPFDQSGLERIFRRIIEESRRIEQQLHRCGGMQ